MQKTLNMRVKYRESFRPFAPSVLREDVSQWFELDTDSPYMLIVADVIGSRRRAMTDDRLHALREKLQENRMEMRENKLKQAFKAELVSEIVQATAQGAAARGGGGCSAASSENPALPPDESEGAAAPSAEARRGSRHAFGRMPIRMKSRQRPDEASGSNS